MQIGCHLPVYGPAATREALTLFARRAEALGYDSLWVSDHVVIPYTIRSRYPYNATGDFPLSPETDFLEPLTVMALVAGVTSKIRLGTSVLVLPHRHPVLTAKILATIDHVAPGRVILGAGVGWMKEEIELLGVKHERRGAWSDEAIRVMRACWKDARVRFKGEFFAFDDVGVRPRPAAGTIPIWIGGHTERALKRVVTLGDGWHAAFPSVDKMRDGIAELTKACAREGRDPATLTISARVGLPARKSADELIAELRALRDLGVHHVILESRMRDIPEMTATYERFAREVRPQL
jgi:probable F420-dependent oxidoreductase